MTEQIEHQPFWEAEGLPEPGARLATEAYMQLPETHIAMELIDNVVVYPHWSRLSMTPAPLLSHQKLVGRIFNLLSQQPGTTYISPVDVRVNTTTILQPDVVWLAPDSQSAEMETHLQGVPELVVEVLSLGTARRD
ncbi:MAG: Uma2 family endonuclease, partial [Chloroflexota bacterium]